MIAHVEDAKSAGILDVSAHSPAAAYFANTVYYGK
jgi:hypothetical protein